MNRTIFGGSLASTIFLIIGTYLLSSSPIMWLASTSLPYTIFRCAVAITLLVVLLTNPPRKLFVRVLMGAMAVTMFAWSIALIAVNSTHLLDIVLFLELGFAFGLEALELTEDEVDERIERLRNPGSYVPANIIRTIALNQWHKFQEKNNTWYAV